MQRLVNRRFPRPWQILACDDRRPVGPLISRAISPSPTLRNPSTSFLETAEGVAPLTATQPSIFGTESREYQGADCALEPTEAIPGTPFCSPPPRRRQRALSFPASHFIVTFTFPPHTLCNAQNSARAKHHIIRPSCQPMRQVEQGGHETSQH